MPTSSKLRRENAKWLFLGPMGIAMLLAVTGAVTETILELRELRRYPPSGRWVAVGGHRLHIHCTGIKGDSPTVLLEAGGGAFSIAWGLVQPALAETGRVCSYDRAGLGWSEPGPPPRNAESAARELRTLLRACDEAGPYVLVGHSYGGIVIRKFFELYPGETAGFVFVDAAYPRQRSTLTPDEKAVAAAAIRKLHRVAELGRFGIPRLFPRLLDVLPPSGSEAFDTIRRWPRHMHASALELEEMPRSLTDPSLESQDFGDRPLVVLTENTSQDRQRLRMKRIEHRRLADRSERGVHIVVDGSSHLSFLTQPRHAAVVVTATREVLTAVGPKSTDARQSEPEP